ncbi:cytochrome P450 [Boletus reticuloceps]|uniref:Cytochrome P450 n=1 Tax=Boletus reticuloceps TaxID=495285 RepID=A0A8I2Z1Q0_9AGAM|nr:cytochrome P450 [Boletus reticuloceps]
MFSSSAAAGLISLILAYTLFKRLTRPSLSMVRGPPSPSFVFGNLIELFQRPVGEADFAWQSQYGNVVRLKSILGVGPLYFCISIRSSAAFNPQEDRLLISDPKALHKVLNTSTYGYPKLPNLRVLSRTINGEGLLWADGEDHKRQRSIMLPGFGLKECKAFLPISKDCADSISMKWMETIGNSDGQGVVINVLDWLSRGSLDAISAAFDVQLNTIENDLHPLAKKYQNFLADVFGLPPPKQIFILAASKFVPTRILQWLVDNGSSPRLARVRDLKIMVTDIAKELVREKADALLRGQGNTDIFTLLIKANKDASTKKRLSDEELLAQMRTLLIAGHETTAATISFIFLELARHPRVQSRLRDEIRKTETTIRARSDPQLTATDLDAMPYLNAVIKEGLRFHPIGTYPIRMSGRDDVLPLSKPVLTESGEMINEVFVPKGTEVMISIPAYNRCVPPRLNTLQMCNWEWYHSNKDIWGEDAHEFKPDRWLDGAMDDKKLPSIGVYSNLMTFSSGPRACLGWRFAVIEIQAFLSTLVGKFEFAMTDRAERIIRQPMIVMAPMVEGELDRGVQMPLAVSVAPQDGDI